MAHPTVSSGPVAVRRSGAPTRSMRGDELFFLGLAALLWILTAVFGATHLHVGALYLPLWLPFAINASIASVAAIALYPRWRFFDDAPESDDAEDVVTVPRLEWEELHHAVRTETAPVAVAMPAPSSPAALASWDEPPAVPAPPRPTPRSATSVAPAPPATVPPTEPRRTTVAARGDPVPPTVPPPTTPRAVPPPLRPGVPPSAQGPSSEPADVGSPDRSPPATSSRPRAPSPVARPPAKAPAAPDAAAQDVDEIIRLLEGTLSAVPRTRPTGVPVAPRGTKGVCIHCGEKIRPESAAILRCAGCAGGLCVDGLAESVREGHRGFCPACRALGAPPSPRR